MAFWSGETLEARLGVENIVEPFDKNQIACAAYTLRMGSEAYITPDHRLEEIESSRKDVLGAKKIQNLSDHEHLVIPAGQFAWLLTKEYLRIPRNAIAFISMRTKVKFKGLINVSGFHVDPGFEGRLVYSVYNAGPQEVRIARGDDLFLIWFANLDIEKSKYYRKEDKQIRIKSEFIVSGEIVSLQGLQREIDKLKFLYTQIKTAGKNILIIVSVIVSGLVIANNWSFITSILNISPK